MKQLAALRRSDELLHINKLGLADQHLHDASHWSTPDRASRARRPTPFGRGERLSSRIWLEPRHEWNVGASDVEAHLREQGCDLAAMVGLMIEHVRDQRPFRNGASLAVDLADVGQRLRKPLR